jgi:hypothetical protein
VAAAQFFATLFQAGNVSGPRILGLLRSSVAGRRPARQIVAPAGAEVDAVPAHLWSPAHDSSCSADVRERASQLTPFPTSHSPSHKSGGARLPRWTIGKRFADRSLLRLAIFCYLRTVRSWPLLSDCRLREMPSQDCPRLPCVELRVCIPRRRESTRIVHDWRFIECDCPDTPRSGNTTRRRKRPCSATAPLRSSAGDVRRDEQGEWPRFKQFSDCDATPCGVWCRAKNVN